jgi:RNA polymerase sigma-70 factor, ECF subfamily
MCYSQLLIAEGLFMNSPSDSSYITKPSLFIRINADQAVAREIAWEEFFARYGPVIAGFARNFGARQHDIDDVIQDVMLGFFSKSPHFIYDPAKGRFRGYLKTCTFNALARRLGQNAKFAGLGLDGIDPTAPEIESTWERDWQQQLLNRALKDVREDYGENKTFRAFELLVMLAEPVNVVAEKLQMSNDSVYQARARVTAAVRKRLAQLEEEEG